ncbi:MAG: hypothetical protein EOO77_11590 [Oxalobacteraceae bacterium]|nr:MAG: hypothetical protein EOO77_11590 [Oxalobacteraceae bacterium]
MLSTLYTVTIAGASKAAPADGFIDVTTIEQYMAQGSVPATYAQTTAKERANIRYKFLREQMQMDANLYLTNFIATGGSATAAPSSVSFTVEVERGDYVLFARDETTPGLELHGIDALVRMMSTIPPREPRRGILPRTHDSAFAKPRWKLDQSILI